MSEPTPEHATPERVKAADVAKAGIKGSANIGRAVGTNLATGNVAGAAAKGGLAAAKMAKTREGRRALALMAFAQPGIVLPLVALLIIIILLGSLVGAASSVVTGTGANQQQSIQNQSVTAAQKTTSWKTEEFSAVQETSGQSRLPWEVPGSLYHVQQAGTNGAGEINGAGMSGVPGEGWVSPMTAKYRLTSYFGARSAPLPGATTNHGGVDLASTGKGNPPVVSPAAGKVTAAGQGNWRCGNRISIDHGSGYTTQYCHLDSISVKAGDEVQMGEQIGHEGTTGNSTGDHLHLNLVLNGAKQDPLLFFQKCGIDFEKGVVYDPANPVIGCKKEGTPTDTETPTSSPTTVAAASLDAQMGFDPSATTSAFWSASQPQQSLTVTNASLKLSPASPSSNREIQWSMSGALAEAPAAYQKLFIDAGRKYGISPNWLAGVAKQESQFNPRARSHAGAMGLMQCMPDTCRSLGISDPYDPVQAVDGGARMYVDYIKKYGPEKALRAYNAGPGNLTKSYRFKETNNYVRIILSDPGIQKAIAEDQLLTQYASSGIQLGLTPGLGGSEYCATPAFSGETTPAGDKTIWDKIAACESTNNWAANTGNGFYGGLQFTKSTWNSHKEPGYPDLAYKATREQQIWVAQKVLQAQGPGAWPVCSKKAGLTKDNGMVLKAAPSASGGSPNATTTAGSVPGSSDSAAGGASLNTPIPNAQQKIAGYSEKGMTNDGVKIARALAAKFPKVHTLYGAGGRPGSSDHPRGAAIDFMVDDLIGVDGGYRSAAAKAYGDEVLKYVLANAEFFHVKYAIWQQTTHYPGSSKKGGRMKDRGDDNRNHYNHVHISLVGSGYPSGSENYGTAPEGGCYGAESVEEGIGPLRILPSALTDEEKELALDLRWSLKWVNERIRKSLKTSGYSESYGLDAGMQIADDGKLSIDKDDKGVQALRGDYVQALAQLPLAGMNEGTAGRVMDTAFAWHTGNSQKSNDCKAEEAKTIPHWDGSQLTVTETMARNVSTAMAEADKRQLTDKGKLILAIVMGVETKFTNSASKKVPESEKATYDDVVEGGDDRVGLFWLPASAGSVTDRMDPAKATNLFVDELLKRAPKYESDPQTAGQIARAITGSSYGDRYDKEEEAAKAIISSGSGQSVDAACPADGNDDEAITDATGAAKTIIEAALTQLGVPYVYGGSTPGKAWDCSNFVQFAYGKAGIKTPGQTGADIAWAKKNGYWHDGMDGIQPGDAAYNGHHVVIYMGGGKHVHAPRTGDVVKVANWSPSSYFGYISLSKIAGSAGATAAPAAG